VNNTKRPRPPLRPVENSPNEGEVYLVQCSIANGPTAPVCLIEGPIPAMHKVQTLQVEADEGIVYHAAEVRAPENFPLAYCLG